MKRVFTILVADDCEIIRAGFQHLFSEAADFSIVAEAANANDLILNQQKHKPDLIILDLMLSGECGLDLAQRIVKQNSKARILIMSSTRDHVYHDLAEEFGISGFIYKNAPLKEILKSVRNIANSKNEMVVHEVA